MNPIPIVITAVHIKPWQRGDLIAMVSLEINHAFRVSNIGVFRLHGELDIKMPSVKTLRGPLKEVFFSPSSQMRDYLRRRIIAQLARDHTDLITR